MTVPAVTFATNAFLPSGVIAIDCGLSPTVITAPGASPATVIGRTWSSPAFVTYAVAPSGVMATPVGSVPKDGMSTAVFAARSTTATAVPCAT